MLRASDFDHLVIAVPNLVEGVEQFESRLGVRAVPGGSHPGLGTANALLGIDGHSYLEILGPDPDQDPALAAGRLAGIVEPTVQRWAVRPEDFDGLVAAAATTTDVDLGEVHDMARRTPDGEVLEWRLTRRTPLALGGIQPFLIDWLDSPHPASREMPRIGLERLWASSPDVDGTRSVLRSLGANLEVEAGETDRLHTTLKGPGGSWTL
ncbi:MULTISPECIES: VOC family protein [unclassified Brevibacterium]|uniref:VOC family protein n=1 Tax=unclassified Brevibacterium TaxID=2614124 RepID=UPI001E64A214|nr:MULTISPECIES: VOC family protein [unclassified Brevibacterium]MCD1287199.1 VOC family protein [Brevibacterium sp. CCUG 69071]MDK8436546.1 VOC family protein [Brevibacterium sp. H-BE7]